MGLDYQGSRAVALLQGMAGHVEAVLGYLDRLVGYHPRRGHHGVTCRSGRLQDHQLYLHLAHHDPGVLSLPLPDRPQPVV